MKRNQKIPQSRRTTTIWITALIWIYLIVILASNTHARVGNRTVLATIDQIEITENDLQTRLNKLPENQKIMYETKAGKKELLQEMVRLEVFYREALEKQLNQKPDYKKKIERIAKGMLASAFVKEYILAIDDISEADAELFYQSHKEQYIESEKIKINSIFFPVNKNQRLKIAQDKADKTMARIKQGESFSLLSKQVSENKTPVKQDYFSKGRLDPAIEDQVFDLNIGEISEVLSIKDGLILFQMEDKIPARQLAFQDVKDNILETLKEEKIKEAFYSTERKLFDKYKVSF